MIPTIRPLDPVLDLDLVTDLFLRSADYVWLERATAPTPDLSTEFFTDTPPGCDPAHSLKLGLFLPTGPLAAIADVGFGYPDPADAFLGLMQFAIDTRGLGLGTTFLRHIERASRDRGAKRLLLAVLHNNPRGRAFWNREGFHVEAENRPAKLGEKHHLATRMVKPL